MVLTEEAEHARGREHHSDIDGGRWSDVLVNLLGGQAKVVLRFASVGDAQRQILAWAAAQECWIERVVVRLQVQVGLAKGQMLPQEEVERLGYQVLPRGEFWEIKPS